MEANGIAAACGRHAGIASCELAAHLVELAEAAEARLEHVGHPEWLERLEDGLDNFRAVLR